MTVSDSLVPPTWEPTKAEFLAVSVAPLCERHKVEDDPDCEGTCDDCLMEQVRAVGPLIAARALREAAEVITESALCDCDAYSRVGCVHEGMDECSEVLRRRAAALEGRAHV